MRNIFTVILSLITLNFAYSQDDSGKIKNFRFGLKVTPSVNWFKPEGKLISNDGIALKYGGGLVLEYRMAKIISFQTGLQIDVSGGKAKYNNGTAVNSNSVAYFYNVLDDKIVSFDLNRLSGADSANYTYYQLNSRSYTTSYITLPLTLKMKTKEIGSFTYYGQFGINNSFRWKSYTKDDISPITPSGIGSPEKKSKIDVTKDVSLYTASLNMGLGAELNLSGTTSFTFGVNYMLGFLNVVKNESVNLERLSNDGSGTLKYTNLPQQIKSNSVVILVGVLF